MAVPQIPDRAWVLASCLADLVVLPQKLSVQIHPSHLVVPGRLARFGSERGSETGHQRKRRSPQAEPGVSVGL